MGGDECREVIRGRRKVSARLRPELLRCICGDRGRYLKDRKVELEVEEVKIPAAIWKGPG